MDPATNGPLTAPIVVAPMTEEEDFAKYRGQLSGKIVLITHPGQPSDPTEPAFKRYTGDELAKLDAFQQPTHDPEAANARLKRMDYARKRDAFLKAEGAVAWAQMARRDGGLLHGEGYLYKTTDVNSLPGVEIAAGGLSPSHPPGAVGDSAQPGDRQRRPFLRRRSDSL